MSGRGMKKWAPYKSLVEQAPALAKMERDKFKIERPHISSDKAAEINEILTNYQQGQEVTIYFYYNGFRYHITTQIIKIDIDNKCLILPEKKIDFIDILDIVN